MPLMRVPGRNTGVLIFWRDTSSLVGATDISRSMIWECISGNLSSLRKKKKYPTYVVLCTSAYKITCAYYARHSLANLQTSYALQVIAL